MGRRNKPPDMSVRVSMWVSEGVREGVLEVVEDYISRQTTISLYLKNLTNLTV